MRYRCTHFFTAQGSNVNRNTTLTKADLGVKTIDDCVRKVTCFESFSELKNTQATYAPKFYVRPATTAQKYAQGRVLSAFNAWAAREGRATRAFIAAR